MQRHQNVEHQMHLERQVGPWRCEDVPSELDRFHVSAAFARKLPGTRVKRILSASNINFTSDSDISSIAVTQHRASRGPIPRHGSKDLFLAAIMPSAVDPDDDLWTAIKQVHAGAIKVSSIHMTDLR